MAFVNHDKKFIFISNARTGCTSMMDMLDQATLGDHRHYLGLGAKPPEYHRGIKETLDQFPEAKNYFKFCFIRNPWDRFLSAHKEFLDSSHGEWNQDVVKYPNFREFCMNFLSLEIKQDIHYLPLTQQMSIDGEIVIDYIAKFENYEEDARKIFNHLNISWEGPLIHTRKTPDTKYQSEYDEISKQIIENFYQEDINNFKYSF